MLYRERTGAARITRNKQTNKLSDYVMLKQAVNATTIVLQSRVSRQGFVDSGVLGVVSKALASFDSIY